MTSFRRAIFLLPCKPWCFFGVFFLSGLDAWWFYFCPLKLQVHVLGTGSVVMWESVVCKYCVSGWRSLWLRGHGDKRKAAPRSMAGHRGALDPSTAQQCVLPGVRGGTCPLFLATHLIWKRFNICYQKCLGFLFFKELLNE